MISVDDLAAVHPVHVGNIELSIEPLLKEFTVMQDLESGSIYVWGASSTQYIRYRISAKSSRTLSIHFEKLPEMRIKIRTSLPHTLVQFTSAVGIIELNGDALIQNTPISLEKNLSFERLSLGNHKAQNWANIYQRRDFSEIFPLWMQLAQQLPLDEDNGCGGNYDLIDACQRAIETNSPENILPAFLHLFLAGFSAGLSPRSFDEDHYGFNSSALTTKNSPLHLLIAGKKLIRRLFIKIEGPQIVVLPHLPPEFHSGRFLNISCAGYGTLDMEWSKKSIRRLIFTAKSSMTLNFCFSKEIKKYRLQENVQSKGRWITTSTPLDIQSGVKYFFDCFEK